MVVNFLYCIDYPVISNGDITTDKITGWLLCSYPIKKIIVHNSGSQCYKITYGTPRPDVAKVFKDFPGNDVCGFCIEPEQGMISMNNPVPLEVEILYTNQKNKKIALALDTGNNTIHDFEYEDGKWFSDRRWKKSQKKYLYTLERKPWITIRMDITNKCNLRCIMCHYKEKEIYSRPAKNITADELKIQLHDIAPYVKYIMLSCGYEPLMSKHFEGILKMINANYPHMEIGMCTNGMLLDSKARKAIIENKVVNTLFSLDGVTKETVERIRVGVDFDKVVSNILALRDLKRSFNRVFPQMYMDFVLMCSNIHEAPAFVGFCKELGMDLIDFRHLVGNVYFDKHDEMLSSQKEKYNYYRRLIIDESKKHHINVRLPEPFDITTSFNTEALPVVDISHAMSIKPDVQSVEVTDAGDGHVSDIGDNDFSFLSKANCLRPFNEIMIVDQEKILPCSYYSEIMGTLTDENNLYSIFLNEKFQKVRKKKILNRFDYNCLNCPIKANLLPTDIVS